MPLYRLILYGYTQANGDHEKYDRLLIDAPSEIQLMELIAHPGDKGYRLLNLVSTCFPEVSRISYDPAVVETPNNDDNIWRWDLVEPHRDSIV